MRHIWAALKKLDTIVPGVLHPSTIMYYPEIKMYANKPVFLDRHFRVSGNVFMVGDGAGTSRGITGAWASGIRAAEDTGRELTQGGPAVPIAANIRNPLLLIPATRSASRPPPSGSSSGRCGNAGRKRR